MAAKRIIVLTQSTNGTQLTYSGVFWIPITSGARPVSAASSWVPNGTSAGAVQAELTAIQNGTVFESPWVYSFPTGTAVATIEAYLQQAWTDLNAQVNGIGGNQFYGSWWDGTVWSNS